MAFANAHESDLKSSATWKAAAQALARDESTVCSFSDWAHPWLLLFHCMIGLRCTGSISCAATLLSTALAEVATDDAAAVNVSFMLLEVVAGS